MNPHVGYVIAKIIGAIKRDKHKETLNKWFVKRGVHLENEECPELDGWTNINSNIAINEPHLIYVGANTTIAGNVEFVTHDNSISKVLPNSTDLYGKITIGRNCFIGARSVILYGVSIADNAIVAAGSVVTHSVNEQKVIVAGNPARIISSWDTFSHKYDSYIWDMDKMGREEMISRTLNGEKLVRR